MPKIVPNQKVREQLLRKLKSAISKTLKFYSPDHKNYKRNLKKLYEGLNEMDLIEGLDDKSNFKEFEEAFRRSKKDTKLMLVVANLFKENDLGQYFRFNRTQKINSLKVIGGMFLANVPKKTLDSEGLMKYLLNLRQQKELQEEIAEYKTLLNSLKNTLKTNRDYYREDIGKIREIKSYIENLETGDIFTKNKIKKRWKELNIKDPILENYEDRIEDIMDKKYGKYDDLAENHKILIEAGIKVDSLITDLYVNAQDRLSAALKIKRQDNMDFKNRMTELHAESIKDIRLVESLLNRNQIANLTHRLELIHEMLDEKKSKDKEVNDSIPNVVQTLQQVIKFKNQLLNISQYCATKQNSINDPGDIIGYGSGGLNKRSRRGKRSGNLQPDSFFDPTGGDTVEGFWARDFSDVYAKIQTYRKLILTYMQILPESELKNTISKLQGSLADLADSFNPLQLETLVQDTLRGTTIKRVEEGGGGGVSGQITNIEEHEGVMKVYNDIKKYLGKTMDMAEIAMAETDKFVAFNKEIIHQAKNDNKSAKQALLELTKIKSKFQKIKKSPEDDIYNVD